MTKTVVVEDLDVPESTAGDAAECDHGRQGKSMGGIVPIEAPCFTVAEGVAAN